MDLPSRVHRVWLIYFYKPGQITLIKINDFFLCFIIVINKGVNNIILKSQVAAYQYI